ncbi:MAG: hypothetical protein IBX40_10010 [Methanosarcinales archaeon]|nr:hypothetical protein [Methanosarcinales archaeon]
MQPTLYTHAFRVWCAYNGRILSGKLVQQDREDEPAGVLLEWIKAEKEIREQNNKPIRRKTRGNKA